MSSLVNFLQSYEFMADNDGEFSICKWVKKGTGSIFISSLSHLRDSLKPLISIFLDTLAKRLLCVKDYPKRKTFFVLEELWTLQRLPSLLDLITQSRSKGGAIILSIQEIAQLDSIYGAANRKTIFNNCSNKLIMGTAESETAEYMSNLIGEQEIIESGKSYHLGIENFKDGINISRNRRVRRVLLPSEIKQIKNLHGVVQISGYPPFPVVFKSLQNQYPDKNPAVIIRDSNKLKTLQRKANSAAA
jgi:type IV secretory pathway TraG/TraD family ATPase VirD4